MTIFLRVGASLILLHVLQSFFWGYSPVYETTAISSIDSPLIDNFFLLACIPALWLAQDVDLLGVAEFKYEFIFAI